MMWDSGDTNWGIYMGQAGGSRSLTGSSAASGLDGRTSYAVRFRVHDNTANIGFLFENSSEEALFQVRGDTGEIYSRNNFYPSNQTTNYVSSARIANWQTAYGWGDHSTQGYITNATASLDASKITSGIFNSARIPVPANGSWWNNGYVRVQTDGVMEVGKYLDFHTSNSGGNVDFDVRVTATSGAIDIDGDLTVDDITASDITTNGITTTGILTVDTSPAANGTGDLKIIHTLNSASGVGYAGQVIGVNIEDSINTSNQPEQNSTWGGVTGATAIALQADDNTYGQFQVWTSPQDSSAGTALTPRFWIAGSGNATFLNNVTTNSSFVTSTASSALGIYAGSTQVFEGSTRNLKNIGTISSGAISAAGSINLGTATDGSRRFKWYNDNNHSLYYDDNILGTASAEVFTYWQNVVFRYRDSTNAVIIGGSSGTISAGAITSSGSITTGGSVGINVASPSSALDIRGAGSGGSQKNTIAFGTTGWGSPAAPNAALDGGVKLALFEGGTQKVQIGMDSNARLWLSSAGSGAGGVDIYTGSSNTAAPSLRFRVDAAGTTNIYGNLATAAISANSNIITTAQLIAETDVIVGESGGAAYNALSDGQLYFSDDDLSDRLAYSIGLKRKDNIGGNYTKLNIDWHTGITLGAATAYGGTRFLANSVGHYNNTTTLFSVGEGDNHTRFYYELKQGNTTVIDSNRNLTNIGTISSGNITAGNSATAALLRAHYNDGSYMTLEGFGLVMNRSASYIRPSTDGNKYLYIGGADASLDWYAIHFRSVNGLYISGTQFLDTNRNLVNIGTISSGAISATGNSTITGSGSSSNALNVYRGSDSASALRVLNTGEVLVSSNYFYVNASQGAYFNGNLRARGGISNDGSNYGGDVRILDTTDVHGNLKISGTTVIDSSLGFSSDGVGKSYSWRAVANTGGSSGYVKIARITGNQSVRFIIELAGRENSYGDGQLAAMGFIVGQLNNDNNFDIVYYNHLLGSSEVVLQVGQVDAGTTATDIYVQVGTFSEVSARANVSHGTITPQSVFSSSQPSGFTAANSEARVFNSKTNITMDSGTSLVHAGTTVMSSSRNLTNIASLTTTGLVSANNYQILGTVVFDSSRVLKAFYFQTNTWLASQEGKTRLFFESSGRTFYGASTGHQFRDSGDTTRFNINNYGGVNLLSGGDGQVASNVALAVSGTTVIDSSRRIYSSGGTVSQPHYSFDGDSDTGMYRMGANQIGFSVGGSNKVYVDSGAFTLNVLGTVYASGAINAGDATFALLNNTGGAKLEIQNSVDGGSTRGIYMWNTSDTNWGIYMSTAGSGKSLSGGSASSGLDGRTSHGIRFRVANSSTQIGFLFENASEQALAQITADSGNFLAKGNVTAYASDERLKTNIKPIQRPLEKLMKLRGVEFDWIDGIEETHGFIPKCKHETGVIAQEVEQVIPDAISPAPFNNEYKTVEHTKIISLLIESVRSQQETIESLTKRIEELENGDN